MNEIFGTHDGLHYRWRAARGTAPVLVFANSLGTDLRVWDALLPLLPADWGLLRHDKRGHGLSTTRAGLSIESMADDLGAVLDHLGVMRFAGVGLSVGGLIMQALYQRRPEAMTHLVLADTAARIGSAALWDPRIATVLQDGIGAISDAILARWFAPDYAVHTDVTLWRMMLERTPAQGYADVCAAIRDADLTAALPFIKARTLVMVGAEDASTPPDLVRATAEEIPGARFEIIPAAGHLPCVEQPEQLAALLRDHLGG